MVTAAHKNDSLANLFGNFDIETTRLTFKQWWKTLIFFCFCKVKSGPHQWRRTGSVFLLVTLTQQHVVHVRSSAKVRFLFKQIQVHVSRLTRFSLNKILTYKSVNSSQETWFGLSMVTRINKGYTLLISKGSLWCWICGRDKWRKKLPGKERCSVVMKLVSCAESWLESELNLKLHGFS